MAKQLIAKFSELNIYETHKFLFGFTKARVPISRIADKTFPRFTSRKHCIAWQLFADACQDLEIILFDYLKMRELEVYDLNNGVYKFIYRIKTGWFKSEIIEFDWDSCVDIKLKEIERLKKEEQKRINKIRGRRR